MRLPLTTQVSLMDLVESSGSQNNSWLLEKLLSLTQQRQNLRLKLKEQDKIVDYYGAYSLYETVKRYIDELDSLEQLVAQNPSVIITNKVVFIWKSALVESSLGGTSGFYAKKIREVAKSANKMAQSAASFATKPKYDTKQKYDIETKSIDSFDMVLVSSNESSPKANESTEPNNLVASPFDQKKAQNPDIKFEKANVLLVLGISKLLIAYTCFDRFEIYIDSDSSYLMLPNQKDHVEKSNSISNGFKKFSGIKNIFPFAKHAIDIKKTGIQSISHEKNGTGTTKTNGKDSNGISDDSDNEQGMLRAVQELRESAGIFEYILTEYSSKIQNITITNSDLNCTVLLILQKLSLADADRLMAGKAVRQKLTPHNISRMLLSVSEQYDQVLELAKTMRLDAVQSLSSEFKNNIKMSQQYVFALALVFLAKMSFEKNEFGFAVGYIKEARSILRKLYDSQTSMSPSKLLSYKGSSSKTGANSLAFSGNDGGSGRYSLSSNRDGYGGMSSYSSNPYKALLVQVESLFALYTRNNDTIGFEPVPDSNEIRARIPLGRPFNQLVEYKPPQISTLLLNDNELGSHQHEGGEKQELLF
ncbi:hypothetical protein BB558_001312 [Smittium angustum]|nr:hypothetical protein BB558_001312 [Smittium angustum]